MDQDSHMVAPVSHTENEESEWEYEYDETETEVVPPSIAKSRPLTWSRAST